MNPSQLGDSAAKHWISRLSPAKYPTKTHVCSATINLSISAERSSSSLLCLRTVAKPFSMSCSAMLLKLALYCNYSLPVSGTIGHGHTFTFIEIPLFGLDIIDENMNRLPYQTFSKESTNQLRLLLNALFRFVRIERLFRFRAPKRCQCRPALLMLPTSGPGLKQTVIDVLYRSRHPWEPH